MENPTLRSCSRGGREATSARKLQTARPTNAPVLSRCLGSSAPGSVLSGQGRRRSPLSVTTLVAEESLLPGCDLSGSLSRCARLGREHVSRAHGCQRENSLRSAAGGPGRGWSLSREEAAWAQSGESRRFKLQDRGVRTSLQRGRLFTDGARRVAKALLIRQGMVRTDTLHDRLYITKLYPRVAATQSPRPEAEAVPTPASPWESIRNRGLGQCDPQCLCLWSPGRRGCVGLRLTTAAEPGPQAFSPAYWLLGVPCTCVNTHRAYWWELWLASEFPPSVCVGTWNPSFSLSEHCETKALESSWLGWDLGSPFNGLCDFSYQKKPNENPTVTLREPILKVNQQWLGKSKANFT